MITFKDFLTEATLKELKAKGFGKPGPRAKYQIGDFVIIAADNRWDIYQSQRSGNYMGQYGKVVAYKQVPGSYVKYAVEFPDKNIEAFHSHYVIGPFTDEAAAKKYAKPGKMFNPKIDPKDIKGSSGGKLDSNIAFENALKTVLTAKPFNLKWLDKPLQFSDKKYTTTVLAVLPLNQTIMKGVVTRDVYTKNVNPKLLKLLGENICFYRINGTVTGKLVQDRSNDGILQASHTPYCISMPTVDLEGTGNEIVYNFANKDTLLKSILKGAGDRVGSALEMASISLGLNLAKNPKPLIDKFNIILGFFNKNFDMQAIFNEIYQVTEIKGKKYINQSIAATPETLHFFQNYTFGKQGYCTLNLKAPDVTKIKQIPPGLTDVNLYSSESMSKKSIIQDFSFIPPTVTNLDIQGYTINSLRGIPEGLKELSIRYSKLNNLNGLPKTINGDFRIEDTSLNSFEGGQNTVIKGTFEMMDYGGRTSQVPKSARGIPKARHYNLEDSMVKAAKKEIKDREFIEKLDPETKEDWSEVLRGL